MIISHPVYDFKATMHAYDQYAKLYNKDKKIGERIRDTHQGTMYQVCSHFGFNVKKNNKIAEKEGNAAIKRLDTENLPHVNTNNSFLGKFREVSNSTVYRRLLRLIEAGVILKVGHGIFRNYDLYINPLLLSIADAENKEARLEPNPQEAFDRHKMATCNHITVSFGNNLNKKIIHQNESGKPDSFQIETTKDTANGNTGNCANVAQKSKNENPLGLNIPKEIVEEWKQNVAPENISQKNTDVSTDNSEKKTKNTNIHHPDPSKTNLTILKAKIDRKKPDKKLSHAEKIAAREKEINEMRISYAILMVETMIAYLYPTFKAYKNYFANTVSYVAEHYFGQLDTFSSIERVWSGYLERLTDAKRFKEHNPGYTPYPHYFFDKNNLANGFENPKWRKNKRRWDKQHRYQTEQRKLQQAIRRFNANPSYNSLQTELEYLKNNTSGEGIIKGFFAMAYKTHGQLPKQININ